MPKTENKAAEPAELQGNPGALAPDEPKTAKKVEKKTMEVDVEKLEALFARIDRLEAAASKAALQHVDDKVKKDHGKVVRVRTLNGKIVVGEKLVKNVVEKSPLTGAWREEQELEISLANGEKINIPYVYYIRNYLHIPAKCVGETKNLEQDDIDTMGDFILKLRFDNGEVMEIGSKFVN